MIDSAQGQSSYRTRGALVQLLCTLILATSALAQSKAMPTISGESLAGNKVVLPEAAKGQVAILVFGFTKASKDPTKAWATKLNSEFANQPLFVLYQLPVLEDVPRLIRGMVISGMKKGVAENLRDHFVPILQGEAGLKDLVAYKEVNDAYLALLDRSGYILEQLHSSSPDAHYSQLQTEIRSLLNQK